MMERLKRAAKNNFVIVIDGFILLSVMTVASWIAYKYKIFPEAIYTYLKGDTIELDELLLLIALFCFGLLVISFRVLLSQRREVARRIKAEREMSDTAERLNKANQFLEIGERIARFGHFRIDGATRELYWSNEVFRIHGLPKDARQPSFEEAMRYFHPDDQAAIRAAAQIASAAVEPYSSEYRIVRPDGAQRDILTWAQSQRSIDGAISSIFGVVQDITERKQAVNEAQRNRDRFLAIFDAVPDGILITDPATGRFSEVNDAASRMFGYDKTELIGCNIGSISSGIYPYTLGGALELHKNERPGNSQVFEWQCKTKNGTLFWAEISTRYTEFGNGPAVLAIIREISERKQAEIEANRGRDRFQAIFDAATDGIFIADPATGLFTEINESGARMLGYDKGELIGYDTGKISSGIHPYTLDMANDGHARAAFGEVRTFEWQCKTKRGTLLWVEVATRSAEFGDAPVRLAIMRDISERKKAEAEIRRESDRLKNANHLLAMSEEFAQLGHWRYIVATQEIDVSDGLYRIHRLPRVDATRDYEAMIAAFVDPDDRASLSELSRNAIVAGEGFVHEGRAVRSDGALRDIATRGEAQRSIEGVVTGVFGICQDVTDRKIAEREQTRLRQNAEQSSQAKSDFLAAMSHEIRTPMNGVLGMNALLLETNLTPDQRKLSETIRYSADVLLNVIDDIVDVAKLEAGRVTLEESDFDLSSLVEKIFELLDVRAKQKGIVLTAEIAADARGEFRGEPARLRQILLNLVANAIKFTERGGVTIAIAGTAGEDDRTRLRIEVRDSGIGVSAEAKKRLFAPFEQADPSIARRFGGTGLGLNISRKLVELMGGQIGIADRPGGGSIFWFEISLARAAADGSAGEMVEPRSAPRVAAVSGRILLAEDNRVNIEVATRILEGAGYTVDVAVDGVEAVAAARQRSYDLILMDMQMPRMDGLSATRQIRASQGTGKRVPIMAMTANAMAGDQRLCLDAGMDDYVSKPISPARLRETVARWIAAAEVPTGLNSIERAAVEAFPVIESDVIESLRSCMTESKFSSLVGLYIAQADAQAQRSQQWRSMLTLREIGDEAHKIISSAGALGARQVQELAGRLQTACRAGDEASMPDLLDQLTLASAAAASALRQRLAA